MLCAHMHTSPALQDSLKGALVDPAVNLEIGLMRQRLRIKDFGSQLRQGLAWGLLLKIEYCDCENLALSPES